MKEYPSTKILPIYSNANLDVCSHICVLENVKESTRTNNLYDNIPNFVVNIITMVHQTVNENDDVFQQENKNDNDYIDTVAS